MNRRKCLGAVGLGLSAVAYNRIARAVAKGPLVSLGFVGCGGRARGLLRDFSDEADIRWACDPDARRVTEFQAASKNEATKTTADLRQVLDDRTIDAVVIATPDHWHAPAAIMACDAGKHVYVEKPCSHNLREGQWLVDAAQRNRCVVQHGTQSRSDRKIAGAIELIRGGLIGDVLACKAWNVQRRRDIGKSKPSKPPAHVDYDTWVGPAEYVPYQANRFHYDWHWWHNFGTGDIGNDGTHEIDIARWGLGVSGLPTTASAIGGKYYFADDQQFPDTAACVFQWSGENQVGTRKQLIFEMRLWSKNYPHNVDTGVEFYGTKGMLFVSKRGKLAVWDDANQPVREVDAESVSVAKSHQVDFLNAISMSSKPAADIATGHASCSLVHLANVSLKVGRSLQIDQATAKIPIDREANDLLGRNYRQAGHWAVPQPSESGFK